MIRLSVNAILLYTNTRSVPPAAHVKKDLVEPILAKGANPTAVNAVGICPLHYTCFADSLSFEAAEALLWRGADPSTAETTYGCTPLHYAASSGDAEICALLMEHGAQPQASSSAYVVKLLLSGKVVRFWVVPPSAGAFFCWVKTTVCHLTLIRAQLKLYRRTAASVFRIVLLMASLVMSRLLGHVPHACIHYPRSAPVIRALRLVCYPS